MTVGVLVLTQPDCDLCDHAKAVLDRLASEFPLEIRTLDLGTEEGAALASTIGLAFLRACCSTASPSAMAGSRSAGCAENWDVEPRTQPRSLHPTKS